MVLNIFLHSIAPVFGICANHKWKRRLSSHRQLTEDRTWLMADTEWSHYNCSNWRSFGIKPDLGYLLVPVGYQDGRRAREDSPGQDRLMHIEFAFNIVIFKLKIWTLFFLSLFGSWFLKMCRCVLHIASRVRAYFLTLPNFWIFQERVYLDLNYTDKDQSMSLPFVYSSNPKGL